MRILIFIFIFVSILPLTSYKQKAINDLEEEKYLNYIEAVQNGSTFLYYTVIKVKDLNTGIIKEICTFGNLVRGAIHKEFGLEYDQKGLQKSIEIAKSKKDRYFEFKNKDALNNVSFFDYRTKLLSKIQKEYNFDDVVEIIKKDNAFSIRPPWKEKKAYAHVLFNKGFLIGENGCVGGELVYVNRKTIQ